MKNCIAKFKPRDIFIAEDPLTQFIFVLTQIHSNLSLTQKYLLASNSRNDLKDIHGDSYMYFLSTLLSHTREALKTINNWMEESQEVNNFVSGCQLDEFLHKIILDKKVFETVAHTQYLIQTRNDIFHYTTYKKRRSLEEVINGLNNCMNEASVFELPNDPVEVYLDYSGQLIAGFISRNTYSEDEFKILFEPVAPVIVSVIKFCNGIIAAYLSVRGVQFNF